MKKIATRTLEDEKSGHLAPSISRGYFFFEVYLQSRSTPCLPDVLLTKQTSWFCASFVTRGLKCLSDNLQLFVKIAKIKGIMVYPGALPVRAMYISYVSISVECTLPSQLITYTMYWVLLCVQKFYSFIIYTCFIIICSLVGNIQLVLIFNL